MKTTKALLLSLSFLLATALQADLYTNIPFKEYADARKQVFDFFDTVAACNGYLEADDGQFLGNISKSHWFDSLNNEWGSYGTSYGKNSIFNSSGTYGSNYSDFSPFNSFALRPPTIRYKEAGAVVVVAYLTKNPYYVGVYALPNIDPSCLCDWLKATDRK